MSIKVTSPLIDVALSYVNDVSSDLSQENLDLIRSLFDKYINGAITYDDIASELNKYLDNLTPLEKISSILNLAFVPPPPSSPIQQQSIVSTKIEDSSHRKARNQHSFSSINSKDFSSSLANASKNRKKTRSWTEDEDQRLLMGVHLHGLENWTLVAQFVGNSRTRSMCSQRWIRVLDPKISKNHWSEEEDQQLLQMVQLYGEKAWMKIASKLGNRSDVQCRYHYKQLQKESKATSISSPIAVSPSQCMQQPQQQQNSIFPTPLNSNFNFANTFFQPVQLSSSNVTPSPTSLKPLNSSNSNLTKTPTMSLQIQMPKQSEPQQEINENLKKFDLPSLAEHELHFRLDEPFGIDESFDFFKSDPMFGDPFWAC